jgi:arylsulfatase A-like enzyme
VPVRRPAGSPNIVIVLMDDMGWADVGCYGSEIATPNIDALAARGIRFTHYTTHPISHPDAALTKTSFSRSPMTAFAPAESDRAPASHQIRAQVSSGNRTLY